MGGHGGDSAGATPGLGGNASAQLGLDGTQSSSVSHGGTATLNATGGTGGDSTGLGEPGAAGGTAADLTGAHVVEVDSTLQGGAGGYSYYGTGGAGGTAPGSLGAAAGNASVKIAVTGVATTANANAFGSEGAFGGGNAFASAAAAGTSGSATADAVTNGPHPDQVLHIAAMPPPRSAALPKPSRSPRSAGKAG